jgi:hypothetical protein
VALGVAAQVLRPGDGLKVGRVDAPLVLAQVVEGQSVRDRPDQRFVGDAVSEGGALVADAHGAVATGLDGTLEQPAAAVGVLDPASQGRREV